MSAEPILEPDPSSELRRQIRDAGLPEPENTECCGMEGLLFADLSIRVKINKDAIAHTAVVVLYVSPSHIENGEAIRWLRRLIERR